MNQDATNPRELFVVVKNFRTDEDYYRAFWDKSHAESYLHRQECLDAQATPFIEKSHADTLEQRVKELESAHLETLATLSDDYVFEIKKLESTNASLTRKLADSEKRANFESAAKQDAWNKYQVELSKNAELEGQKKAAERKLVRAKLQRNERVECSEGNRLKKIAELDAELNGDK